MSGCDPGGLGQDELQAVKVSAVSSNDWRMALGEVSLNLRRELADKAGRCVHHHVIPSNAI